MLSARVGSISDNRLGGWYAYRAAKAAQNMLTLCMQDDPSLEGFVIASLQPGLLRTDSGSADSWMDADQGAGAFIRKVKEIDGNGAYQIHARGFDAGGSERFARITVNSVSTGQQENPAVAVAPVLLPLF